MTALEGHYRRLLGIYPAEHREAYQEEMLGVLMSGSTPGQRFPALGEALDLLRAGVLTRIGHSGRSLSSDAWRDACAVVGALTAVVLLAVAGRRLSFGAYVMWQHEDRMRAYGVDGLLLLDVAFRTVAWLAVVIALGTGLRRTAAGLGVMALLVELAALVSWLPRDSFRPFQLAWAPVLMVLGVVALFVSIRGRSAVRVLGRRGTALVAAGLTVGVLAALPVRPDWVSGLGLGDIAGLPQPLVLIVAALVLAGIRCARPKVRRRILVLIAPAVAVPVTQVIAYTLVNVNSWPDVTAPMILMLAGVLIPVPLATFTFGLLVLERRERAAA
jgi:hypothetical protein